MSASTSLRHLLDGVGRAVAGRLRAAVAAQVHGQHAVGTGELRELVAPVGDVAGVAVDQHQGLAGIAVQLIVETNAVDCRGGHCRYLQWNVPTGGVEDLPPSYGLGMV